MIDAPYDTYVNIAVADLPIWTSVKAVGEDVVKELGVRLPLQDIKSMLTDAWLSGLAYSLELIEPPPRVSHYGILLDQKEKK
jgi:hypothetical protein